MRSMIYCFLFLLAVLGALLQGGDGARLFLGVIVGSLMFSAGLEIAGGTSELGETEGSAKTGCSAALAGLAAMLLGLAITGWAVTSYW